MSLRLGEILVSQGAIDDEMLAAALSDQKAFGGKLGRTLVDLGYASEDQLMRALSTQLELPIVDLDALGDGLDRVAIGLLPVDVCERFGVFPVRFDGKRVILAVATAEPDRKTLQEVAQIARVAVEALLAPSSAIDRATRRAYFGERRSGPPRQVSAPEERDLPDATIESEESLEAIVPSAPVSDEVKQLRTLVVRLEKHVQAQGRVMRTLVELLQEKGVVRRGELGARTTRRPR